MLLIKVGFECNFGNKWQTKPLRCRGLASWKIHDMNALIKISTTKHREYLVEIPFNKPDGCISSSVPHLHCCAMYEQASTTQCTTYDNTLKLQMVLQCVLSLPKLRVIWTPVEELLLRVCQWNSRFIMELKPTMNGFSWSHYLLGTSQQLCESVDVLHLKQNRLEWINLRTLITLVIDCGQMQGFNTEIKDCLVLVAREKLKFIIVMTFNIFAAIRHSRRVEKKLVVENCQ